MSVPASYTFETIKTILLAYGLKDNSNLSVLKPSRVSQTELIDIYFHPVRDLASLPNLLAEDNIAYFRAKKKKVRPRRVCFLLKRESEAPLALVVQWDGLKGLSAEGSDFGSASIAIANNLKKLYGRIECTFIGSLADDTLMEKLKPAVENAIEIETGRVKLDFLPLPEHHPHVVLIEYIFSMLTNGETTKVDAEAAFIRHYQSCTKKLFDTLNSMNTLTLYPKIQLAFIQLVKYKKLAEKRAVLFKDFNELTKPNKSIDREYLEDLIEQDAQNKTVIARTPKENINDYLNNLDWNFLIQLLGIEDQEGSWLEALTQAKERCHRQMRTEEERWNQCLKPPNTGWGAYLWHYAKRAVRYVYKKTLPYFTAAGIHSIGQNLAPGKKIGKNRALILKVGGVSLGLGVSYFLGFRSLMLGLALAINQIVFQVTRWWEGEGINEKEAEFVLPRRRYLRYLNPANLLTLYILGKDLIEIILIRQMLPIIRFGTSTFCRIAVPLLARVCIPTLRHPPGTIPTEAQASKLSLCGMGGFAIGYGISNVALKLKAVGDLLSAISHHPAPPFALAIVDRPNFATRPELWFNDDNPVRLILNHWASGRYFESNCNIYGLTGIVTCEAPVPIDTAFRLLARP